MHSTRNTEAGHGTRQLLRQDNWTEETACVPVGALTQQLSCICLSNVVVPDDVEEESDPVEDGRRVHEKYDREENSVLGATQAFSPVEDDEPRGSDGGQHFPYTRTRLANNAKAVNSPISYINISLCICANMLDITYLAGQSTRSAK